jgi:hypothetical protein
MAEQKQTPVAMSMSDRLSILVDTVAKTPAYATRVSTLFKACDPKLTRMFFVVCTQPGQLFTSEHLAYIATVDDTTSAKAMEGASQLLAICLEFSASQGWLDNSLALSLSKMAI